RHKVNNECVHIEHGFKAIVIKCFGLQNILKCTYVDQRNQNFLGEHSPQPPYLTHIWELSDYKTLPTFLGTIKDVEYGHAE
ncbi:MAG: hypothetical protein ACRDAQ_06155, partial [Cetobacterium sp.]